MKDRSATISRLTQNREFRAAYIAGKLKVIIPAQIRALRLRAERHRQEDLAKAAEMKQSRISAMETPGAVNFNLDTLIRLASALKVGLVVKFVSFSEMLRWENEFSQDFFNPVTIDKDLNFQGEKVSTMAAATFVALPATPGNSGIHDPEKLAECIAPRQPQLAQSLRKPFQQENERERYGSLCGSVG